MKRVIRPTLVIPLVMGAAILAALVVFSNPARVAAVMEGFNYTYLLYILALMVAYETFRCAQWCYLLRALGIYVPLRTQIFSFLGGEIAGFLPVGTYFRNYLLGRSKGTGFSLSSAATALGLVSEIFLCLAGVVIVGLDEWNGWLRPLIVIGMVVFLFLVWAIRTSGIALAAPRRLKERAVFQKAMSEVQQFRVGAATLLRSRVLVVQSTLGAFYLIVAGSTLYMVLHSLGIDHVTYRQALGVFFFSLAFFLISPVSVGMIEVSGVAALVVVGVNESAAVGAMLIYRVLRTGFPLAIAVIGLAILHGEVRAALRERPG